MPTDFFNSSADDPHDKYAHTGYRQETFAKDLDVFLTNADGLSDRYSISQSQNVEGNTFYMITFLDDNSVRKTSIYLGMQPSKDMDVSSIIIDLVKPDLPKDNLIYFVDARNIILGIAQQYDVICDDKRLGHFRIGGHKFFSDVENQLRKFLINVEKAIRIEPNSINNKSRMNPQPRIPMQ